jgi:hypothetical protein
MPKTCNHENCNNPVFGGGYCKHHQYLRPHGVPKPKAIKEIAPMSKRKKEETGHYVDLRQAFLATSPLCQAKLINICSRIATEVHHKQGRTGEYNCPIAA